MLGRCTRNSAKTGPIFIVCRKIPKLISDIFKTRSALTQILVGKYVVPETNIASIYIFLFSFSTLFELVWGKKYSILIESI